MSKNDLMFSTAFSDNEWKAKFVVADEQNRLNDSKKFKTEIFQRTS